MANGRRYQFGDVLLPVAEDLATALPRVMAQQQRNELLERQMNQDNRRIDLAEKNAEAQREFRDRQVAKEDAFRQQELAYRKEQAEKREMNNLLRGATDPARKAMIYSSYGDYASANYFNDKATEEADYKTSLKTFYSTVGDDNIISEASNVLSTLDPTSGAYANVVNTRDQAIARQKNIYADMLKIPEYQLRYNAIETVLKNPMSTGKDIKNAITTVQAIQKDYETKVLNRGKVGSYEEELEKFKTGTTTTEQTQTTTTDYADDLLNEEVFAPDGQLSFLPAAQQTEVKTKIKNLEPEYDKLTSELAKLKSQRQGKYNELEKMKEKLSTINKQVRYYNRIKDKKKRKEAVDSRKRLASEVRILQSEVDKLKQVEFNPNASSGYGEDFLGFQIVDKQRAITKLQRQGKRLAGLPIYTN
tara:strand:- start:6391 stop:7644 length:1254 start_codon:yes stop_codon:yes gene_type:complete